MEHQHDGLVKSGGSGVKIGFLVSFILVIGLGVVNFGYAIGVFNSLQKDFMVVFNVETEADRKFWSSMITTLCSLGLAVGSLTAGPLASIGKKNCIFIANILVAIGCTLTLIKVKEVVAVGRFIYGYAGGAFSVFVPSFINELTPTEYKGPFGVATQLLITFGIFISNVVGIPLPDCHIPFDSHHCEKSKNIYTPGFIGDDYWRILFAIPIMIAVIQSLLILLVFNYETPKFLKQQGRKAELNALMGRIYSSD